MLSYSLSRWSSSLVEYPHTKEGASKGWIEPGAVESESHQRKGLSRRPLEGSERVAELAMWHGDQTRPREHIRVCVGTRRQREPPLVVLVSFARHSKRANRSATARLAIAQLAPRNFSRPPTSNFLV